MSATVGTPTLWIGFSALILVLLALDLFVFHRKAHVVRMREAVIWTCVWVAISLVFNGVVAYAFGWRVGLEFFTGYLIEKALSVDNLFVFAVVFAAFAVPAQLQHRVLFWGVLGALIMRAVFVGAGAALIHRFHWVTWVFGAFLIFTGVRLLLQREGDVHPDQNPLIKLLKRRIPITSGYRGPHFFVLENGRRFATPLFLVLVAVEATDIVFAVDSIPAIFAVTSDPFVVYTSNIFAILGLRSLYFALQGLMARFHYVKVGLALVLAFVGAKMLVARFVDIPIGVSLAVIAALLAGSVIASLVRPPDRPAMTGG